MAEDDLLAVRRALAWLVGFARDLRASGLTVSIDQLASLAEALPYLEPFSTQTFRNAARATLASRWQDLAVFEAVFDRYWLGLDDATSHGQAVPIAPRHDPRRWQAPALATLMAQRARPSDPEVDTRLRNDTASPDEVLRHKDFAKLTEQELAATQQLLRTQRWNVMQRRSHRKRSDRRGRAIDLRRTVQRATRYRAAGFPIARRTPKIKPRPLVILADVSGSMEAYTRLFLLFVHALGRCLDSRVETFVFATRLTRITAKLDVRQVDVAIEQVCSEVMDFAGGTRIGESLLAFNSIWAPRVLERGAVTLVLSDGCECGDVEHLRRQVRRVRDRCYRLIWLNPRLGSHGYEPRVAGMAAALESVDDFLPAHNLQSLGELADRLARLPPRRSHDHHFIRREDRGLL